MTIKEFFNDSPLISSGFILLYAAELFAVVILIWKILKANKNN